MSAVPFLWIISPTNSGSSYLKRALHSVPELVTYDRNESTQYDKFPGATTFNTFNDVVFTRYEDRLRSSENSISDIKQFIISTIKQEHKTTDDKLYILDKNPILISSVEDILALGKNDKIIFLIRNPYAIFPGLENMASHYKPSLSVDTEIIAKHILRMFEIQYDNVNRYKDQLLITYESMTLTPEETSKSIKNFLGASFVDISQIDQGVKDYKETRLKDFNQHAIDSISANKKEILRSIFQSKQYIFDFFGYEV